MHQVWPYYGHMIRARDRWRLFVCVCVCVCVCVAVATDDFSEESKRAGCTLHSRTNPMQAPEGFNLSYGYPADVWAAGVMMYYVLSSDFPFKVERCVLGGGGVAN